MEIECCIANPTMGRNEFRDISVKSNSEYQRNFFSPMTHVLPDRVAFVPPLRPVMVANPLQILGADFVVISHVVPAHSLWLGVHFRGWPVGQYPWGRVLAGPETLLGRPVVITPDVSDNGAHVVCFMFSSPFFWSWILYFLTYLSLKSHFQNFSWKIKR